QINRSNFSAEFGRAGGGLINIVSKSGSNRFAGTIFAFLRDQSLDARNAFAFGPNGSRIDPAYDRLQAGLSLSAPLRTDRTFAFLSYEGMRQRESRFVTFLESADFFQRTSSQQALIQGLRDNPSPALRTLASVLNSALTTSRQSFPATVALLESNSGAFPYRN